ncbi:MAG: phosphoribosyl-ATP diphosphatase [Acidimicrobiia bacterium]
MIVPSIDIVAGQAVQLVGGEALALEAGNPRPILERFSLAGEVAVIDIDAARGEGDNSALIAELCRMAPVRVGGGIRDLETARRWLDLGAEKVIIGTAAEPKLVAALPRERVIVALDTKYGEVVTHGWRRSGGRDLWTAVEAFAGLAGGFLVTFVEREGRMAGTDLDRAARVVEAAGDARVTIAGGVTSPEEVAALDRIGADTQVGMALYTGELGLAEAIAAPLVSDRVDGLWPTVVVDEHGTALGLTWSDLESLSVAVETQRGVYRSRSRGLWVKGEKSGAVQELLRIDLDCDRDALRFQVRQADPGFCHQATRTCWGEDRGLHRLSRRLRDIVATSPEGSNTARLASDPDLLAAKLCEEAAELAEAGSPPEIAAEAADLLYFLLVKAAAAGVDLGEIESLLDRRERRVTRRPMEAKEMER